MSLSFYDLIDTCKISAILNKLSPSEQSDWRYFCRQYSVKFHTPLHLVEEMSPEHIVLHLFESQLENVDAVEDIDSLIEKIKVVEDPNYEFEKEKDLQDFIKQAEKEEADRIKSGKPIHKALENEPTLNPVLRKLQEKDQNLPTRGSVDLSHLSQDEES